MDIPKNSVLRGLPLFRGLTVSELGQVRQALLSRTYPTGGSVLELGEDSGTVQIILEGSTKVSIRRRASAETLLTILGPGEILGEISAMDGLPHSASVLALEPTCVATVESERFCELVKAISTLNWNLSCILAQRLRRVTGQAEAIASLNVTGRVARQLLLFMREYGRVGENDETQIPLRLTQCDLASLVGASREMVNRSVQYLLEEKIIVSIGRHRLAVRDPYALAKLCGQ